MGDRTDLLTPLVGKKITEVSARPLTPDSPRPLQLLILCEDGTSLAVRVDWPLQVTDGPSGLQHTFPLLDEETTVGRLRRAGLR